jgi:endonuclease G, mitochondrial
MTLLTRILFFSLLLATSLATAEESSCPEHFADGQAPSITNLKLSPQTRDVCYSGYAFKHSGLTRTPLYSAEHLTSARLLQAKGMRRSSKFFPDPHIPAAGRAELSHYAHSGYDRGHVAPSADMPDAQSQQECFSLGNMVPQLPEINRGVWEKVERSVRKMAKERGEIYVVSGPLFLGSNIQRMGGAVMVPTHTFKAIYDPLRGESGAYLVDNVPGAQSSFISIAELEKLAGMNLFPAVADNIKSVTMNLQGARVSRPRTYAGRRGYANAKSTL